MAEPLGAVPAGQVNQAQQAAAALDEGADRRVPGPADDQVAFPVPEPAAVLDLDRPVDDQLRGDDAADPALIRTATALAQGRLVRSRVVSVRLSPPAPPW